MSKGMESNAPMIGGEILEDFSGSRMRATGFQLIPSAMGYPINLERLGFKKEIPRRKDLADSPEFYQAFGKFLLEIIKLYHLHKVVFEEKSPEFARAYFLRILKARFDESPYYKPLLTAYLLDPRAAKFLYSFEWIGVQLEDDTKRAGLFKQLESLSSDLDFPETIALTQYSEEKLKLSSATCLHVIRDVLVGFDAPGFLDEIFPAGTQERQQMDTNFARAAYWMNKEQGSEYEASTELEEGDLEAPLLSGLPAGVEFFMKAVRYEIMNIDRFVLNGLRRVVSDSNNKGEEWDPEESLIEVFHDRTLCLSDEQLLEAMQRFVAVISFLSTRKLDDDRVQWLGEARDRICDLFYAETPLGFPEVPEESAAAFTRVIDSLSDKKSAAAFSQLLEFIENEYRSGFDSTLAKLLSQDMRQLRGYILLVALADKLPRSTIDSERLEAARKRPLYQGVYSAASWEPLPNRSNPMAEEEARRKAFSEKTHVILSAYYCNLIHEKYPEYRQESNYYRDAEKVALAAVVPYEEQADGQSRVDETCIDMNLTEVRQRVAPVPAGAAVVFSLGFESPWKRAEKQVPKIKQLLSEAPTWKHMLAFTVGIVFLGVAVFLYLHTGGVALPTLEQLLAPTSAGVMASISLVLGLLLLVIGDSGNPVARAMKRGWRGIKNSFKTRRNDVQDVVVLGASWTPDGGLSSKLGGAVKESAAGNANGVFGGAIEGDRPQDARASATYELASAGLGL